MPNAAYGLCFHRDEPAAGVVERVRSAEQLGYDEFWVIEDCFFTGGVSLAAAALVATETIGVGIGIMPVAARNAAISAMEIATLAELAPGRFHAGMGHGVQFWMEQMNARVGSPLTLLEETMDAVQRLLAGEELTIDGRYVSLEKVALDQAPAVKPLVSAGVRGPKSLEVAGRVADGTIMADFVSAEYIRWAREHIATDDHRITVFASLAMAPAGEADEARQAMSFHLAETAPLAPQSLRMAPFWEELEQMAAASSWLEAVQAMPAEWWPIIAPVGGAGDAVAYVESIVDAGADAVAFFPSPFEPLTDGEFAARELLPLLR